MSVGSLPDPGADGGRIAWLDAGRGIGIVLVVYAHVSRSIVLSGFAPATAAAAVSDSLIYAFHMPLFFLISGLVTRRPERGDRVSFVLDRVMRIAYPYVLWTIIFVLAAVVGGNQTNNALDWTALAKIGYLPIAHFWFLYVLFLCSMVLLVPSMRAILAIVIVGMLVTMLIGMGRMPERTAYFLPFFVAGVALTTSRAAGLLADARRATLIGAAAWLLFLVTFLLSPLDAGGGHARSFLVSRWVTGFAGIVGTLAIASLIGGRVPVLCALGRVSMPIYLMSPMASAFVRMLLVHAGISLPPSGWILVLTLAGILLPWLAYRMLHATGLAALAGLDKARRPIRLGAGTSMTLEPPLAR